MNSRNRKESRDWGCIRRAGAEAGREHEQQKQEGEQGQGLHQENRGRSRKGA